MAGMRRRRGTVHAARAVRTRRGGSDGRGAPGHRGATRRPARHHRGRRHRAPRRARGCGRARRRARAARRRRGAARPHGPRGRGASAAAFHVGRTGGNDGVDLPEPRAMRLPDPRRIRAWWPRFAPREGAAAAALRAGGTLAARRTGTWLAAVYALLATSAAVLPPGGITFLLAYVLLFVLVYWGFRRREVPPYVAGAVMPFFVILAAGLHGVVRHDLYDALKDAWYVLYPALALLTGYALMRAIGRVEALVAAILVTALLTALVHLSVFAFKPELLHLPAAAIRKAAGTGYYAVLLGVALPLGAIAVPGLVPRRHLLLAAAAFLASAASLAAAFSRTLPIVAAILLLALVLPVTLRRAAAFAAAFAVLAAVVAAGGLNADSAARYRGGDVLKKWTRMLEELEIREYSSLAQINPNWRGHESARGIATWAAGNPLEQAFGRGFGKPVDMGLYINLSLKEKSRYIPILHNGYVYLLVKAGLVGLAAYLWALVYMAAVAVRRARDPDPRTAALGRLLVALVLVFAVTTIAISGLFNKRDLVPLALFAGSLLGWFSLRAGAGQPRARATAAPGLGPVAAGGMPAAR